VERWCQRRFQDDVEKYAAEVQVLRGKVRFCRTRFSLP
jgi:hypothetical protein